LVMSSSMDHGKGLDQYEKKECSSVSRLSQAGEGKHTTPSRKISGWTIRKERMSWP